MAKTAHALAAQPSVAWKANAVSSAIAAPIRHRNASAANSAARPASPEVIVFAETGSAICMVCGPLRSPPRKPDSRFQALIEIKPFGKSRSSRASRGSEAAALWSRVEGLRRNRSVLQIGPDQDSGEDHEYRHDGCGNQNGIDRHGQLRLMRHEVWRTATKGF